MSFSLHKSQILAQLDKSPKGSIDFPIVSLLETLNSINCFVSLSSCSGRITLRDDKLNKYCLNSHDYITIDNILSVSQFDHLLTLRYEPFILSILAADNSYAGEIYKLALECNFRESGLSLAANKKNIVTIRSNNRLEVPLLFSLFFNGDKTINNNFYTYLQLLVDAANSKMEECRKKYNKLHLLIKKKYLDLPTKNNSYLFVTKKYSNQILDVLKRNNWKDRSRKVFKTSFSDSNTNKGDSMIFLGIPILDTFLFQANEDQLFHFFNISSQDMDKCRIIIKKNFISDSIEDKEPYFNEYKTNTDNILFSTLLEKLTNEINKLLINYNATKLMKEIPQSWQKINDILLFPNDSFSSINEWSKIDNIWKTICIILGGKRIARQNIIENVSGYRKSQVQMLFNEDNNNFVENKEHGIIYRYDITCCMFSKGNINERNRIWQLVQPNEIIVDLYVGIGYFSLPILIKSQVSHLYACDWHNSAIRAFRENIFLNQIDHNKVTILEDDNRDEKIIVQFENRADRVILGLIPTSIETWKSAIRALKSTGGFMHIHEVARIETNTSTAVFKEPTLCELYNTIHITLHKILKSLVSNEVNIKKKSWSIDIIRHVFVKSYAPKLQHVVVDVKMSL